VSDLTVALARWPDYQAGSVLETLSSERADYGRRCPVTSSSTGCSVPGRYHRWHPQSPRTEDGLRGAFLTAQQVGSLRRYHAIPRFVPSDESPGGELLPISQAAKILGVAASTLHRWLNAGLVAGEQLTSGAPGVFVSPKSYGICLWTHRQTTYRWWTR
jgi:hypothetical protein